MYVHYGESGEPWHEHYVIRAMDDSEETGDFVILTADGDVYVERLRSPPHGEIRWGGRVTKIPDGLGARRGKPVNRFDGPIPPEVLASARARARGMISRRRPCSAERT